jgi:hypothetical protein
MNWQDDKELFAAQMRRHARTRLFRSAIIWTPLFVVSGSALVFFTVDRAFLGGDRGGTWFLVVVLSILTVLFGFQSIQALLDVFGHTRELTGQVIRRWSRTDSLVVRSHYIRMDTKQIFQVDRTLHGDVAEGDWLRLEYYPHTAILITVDKVPPPENPNDPATAPDDF